MLVLNEIASVDVALQVGGSTETVEVTGAPPVIDTTTTQLGAVMTDQLVPRLPLSTRNTYQLLQLQPGVQSQLGADLFYGSSNPGVVSVNGGRGRSNNYMVNGGDGNDIFVNGPAIQPSPDAIEEFRVLTNTFDAEYGRQLWFHRQRCHQIRHQQYSRRRLRVLSEQCFEYQGIFRFQRSTYQQNQFGATLGGPIKKDKTFIFGSYEGNRLKQGISSGNVYLPTAAEANQGDFSADGQFQGVVTDQTFASTLYNRGGGACASALGVTAPAAAAQLAALANGSSTNPVPYASLFPNSQVPTQCFDPTANALYKNYVAPVGTGVFSYSPNLIENDDQFHHSLRS